MLQSLLVLSLIGFGAVVGYEIPICNEDEFLDFAYSVNQGVLYRGVTLVLESDLDFSDKLTYQFEPIGTNYSYFFPGTFDGRGHVISNLAINSSSGYTGLFGYAISLNIRNLVMDSSCSIANSFSSGLTYVGGFIGNCYSDTGNCALENNVNMGNVNFNGYAEGYSRYVFLGGIAGYVYAKTQYSSIKNCANYGSVTNSGINYEAYISGIAGRSYYVNVQNCLNYGNLQHKWEATKDFAIGGIVGYGTYSTFENCVNVGALKYGAGSSTYIGNIIGYGTYTISLSHCYWNEGSQFGIYGYVDDVDMEECAKISEEFVLDKEITAGKYTGNSLLGALNAYADNYKLREYSSWLTNKDDNPVTFVINGKKTVTMNSQVILLPSLASGEKLLFDGWYTDKECTAPLEKFSITAATDLYAKFGENTNTYTISFDTRGGSPIEPIQAHYHDIVELPMNISKKGYAFVHWENEVGDEASWEFFMPSYNVTLYAVWVPIRISTAKEFIEFSKVVNSGKVNYSGTTVYLDSDIEFTSELSEQFEPIGRTDVISNDDDIKKYVLSNITFDGQGYVISKLVINASTIFPSMYAGLFGYSIGSIIKNVVIDKSCTMVTSHMERIAYDGPYVGGIIGYCSSRNSPCLIDNCVNSMDIIHTGYVYTMYLGGIVGYLVSSKYPSTISYCVNYGKIELGDDLLYYTAYIGGILGEGYNLHSMGGGVYVQSSINYGTVKFDGNNEGSLYIDGIIGYGHYTMVWNCTNYGNVIDSQIRTNDHLPVVITLSVFVGIITVILILAFYSLMK